MTVNQVLNDPQATAVFQKWAPELLRHPMIRLAGKMQLSQLVQYAGLANISRETVSNIQRDLEQLS